MNTYHFNEPTIRARRAWVATCLRSVPDSAVILDIGAGSMPYRELLEGKSRRYVALDLGRPAHVIGTGALLPFHDASIDVITCFQVLEHVESPDALLSEAYRVLRPSGLLLLSTHGAFPYHPHPRDLWRWTAEGMEALFGRNGYEVQILGLVGTGTSLSILVAFYLDRITGRRPLRAREVVYRGLHRVGRALDRRFPRYSDPWQPGSLLQNYYVKATKPKQPIEATDQRPSAPRNSTEGVGYG